MYCNSISILYIKPCTTGGGRIKFQAKLDHPVYDVLPYLNAEIKTALYVPQAKTFSFKIDTHIITINDDKLTATQLTNEAECYEMIDYLKDLINHTWDSRASITPFNETRQRPNAIQLYKLLPKTNCKECGEATCMAFATKLTTGKCRLDQCSQIIKNQDTSNYKNLEAYLSLLGYETDAN